MSLLTPLQILDQVRVAKRIGGAAGAGNPAGGGIGSIGAPPHLVPGQKIMVPDLGIEGEVIAYGRAHTVVAPAGGAGA